MNDKIKAIRIATIIALLGNAALAAVKIASGVLFKSGALTADGIDSSGDVLISLIALVIVGIISKPADKEHPYGHRRAETVATAALSFVLFFMGAQLIINAVSNMVANKQREIPSYEAMIVAGVSIAGKMLLALSQYVLGKRAGSALIKANAKNMTGDVLVSFSVLIGLIVSRTTSFAYADGIITILIGLWIIKTSIGIFLETNLELMDGSKNTDPYRVITEAVDATEGAINPHRARMRRIAGFWDISFDINVEPDRTVLEAHNIATQVEAEIKKRLENIFDIMIHIEPSDDNAVEAFGLSDKEMRDSGQAERLDESEKDKE